MKKRAVLYGFFCFLMFLLSRVTIPFTFHGVGPCYVLAAVVCVALTENEKVGALLGLCSGLLLDLAGGGLFGMTAVLYAAVGYLIGAVSGEKIRPGLPAALLFVSAALFVRDVLSAAEYALRGGKHVGEALLSVTLPKLLMTLPVTVVVYLIVRWFGTSRFWRNVDEEY